MASYTTIEADNSWIRLGDNDTLENTIIDFSNGNWKGILADGDGWAIRNVGFKGTHAHDYSAISLQTNGGNGTVHNVYLGDGCIRPDQYASHGQVGIFVHRDHAGHIEITNVNVQDWPNNGIYASAPGQGGAGGGSVAIRNCYGCNNYVSTFRIGSADSVIENCVAFNSNDGRYNGRPFWGWYPGPYDILDCDFQSGPYPKAIFIERGGATAYMENTQYDSIRVGSNDTLERGPGNGNSPDLSAPNNIPTTPEQAASESSTGTPDPNPGNDDEVDLEPGHVVENVHVNHTGGENPVGIRALNGVVKVRNSQIEGPNPRVTEGDGEIVAENSDFGEEAEATPPDGVPLSALEATGELENSSDPP